MLPPALAARQAQWQARWRLLAPRERRLLTIATTVIGLLLLWSLFVQPAWRTAQAAPLELARLDTELLQMQRLAAEARELRNTPPLPPGQAVGALQAATARLGEKGRLQVQGDRAVLSVNGAGPGPLRDWLAEARSARARGRWTCSSAAARTASPGP
ncbi:type II secretion system protein M [Aquabacterium sp. J223]|uniref:type II secretion system protein M n=1 Tax=Aquabacterium sp. J223 TaxID=2898431 RepID=UPI0021AD89B6|nr:type II secretion system protein M [Aquabacterium sp. J223]UUX96517.1 type II secretion system protein M [Aquabacterium sp. J223]